MSIPKKGSRKITVGNEEYLWLIRKKATNSQADYGSGCIHIAIERADSLGSTLLIYTDRKHPKDWSTKTVVPVIPADISKWIVQALELGWKPEKKGPIVTVEIKSDEMRFL